MIQYNPWSNFGPLYFLGCVDSTFLSAPVAFFGKGGAIKKGAEVSAPLTRTLSLLGLEEELVHHPKAPVVFHLAVKVI